MILPPDSQDIIKRGQAYERLVTSPDWDVFLREIQGKRDMWLGMTASSADRVYLAAQAHTVNYLSELPFKSIDAKNELQRMINMQLEADNEAQPEEAKPAETRPPPQFV